MPGGRENLLPPIKPGEVRNPKGINQYTYRADAEKHLDEWCADHGRELVRVIANAARDGKPWAAKLLLDRVLPAVTKHEVDVLGADAFGLGDALATAAKSKRINGDDRDPDARPGNGSA